MRLSQSRTASEFACRNPGTLKLPIHPPSNLLLSQIFSIFLLVISLDPHLLAPRRNIFCNFPRCEASFPATRKLHLIISLSLQIVQSGLPLCAAPMSRTARVPAPHTWSSSPLAESSAPFTSQVSAVPAWPAPCPADLLIIPCSSLARFCDFQKKQRSSWAQSFVDQCE